MTARMVASAVEAARRGDVIEAMRCAWDDGHEAGVRSLKESDFRNPFRDLVLEMLTRPEPSGAGDR